MTVKESKVALDTITRSLAITRLDIEHHQAIDDYSLNIHGEYFFRDVFSFVYNKNYVNANYNSHNAPYIDLVEKTEKEVVQITTTTSKRKIIKSLKSLDTDEYSGHKFKIYYLLEKPNPRKTTIDEVKNNYPSVDLSESLKDYTDLLEDIRNLETSRMIQLSNKYFSGIEERYTDIVVLDLVYKKLLKEHANVIKNYDDSFGSIETQEKIILNNINENITAEINGCLHYTSIVASIDNGDLANQLRLFIIDELYKEILVESLKNNFKKSNLVTKQVVELQNLAAESSFDFNKLIHSLHQKILNMLLLQDFNSMKISWILISYFFEICDLGIKENGTTK